MVVVMVVPMSRFAFFVVMLVVIMVVAVVIMLVMRMSVELWSVLLTTNCHMEVAVQLFL